MITIPLDGIVSRELRLTTDAFMQLVKQTGAKPGCSIIYTYFVDVSDHYVYTLTEQKLTVEVC